MPTFEHHVCPACAGLCSNVTIQTDGNRITEASHVCSTGANWYLTPEPEPGQWIDGKQATLGAAVDRAAQLLADAQMPLVVGLDGLTVQAQQAAFHLARSAAGAIDIALDPDHMWSLVAMQDRGKSTASLGEINQRADTVLFWNIEPDVAHPHFMNQYCSAATRSFVIGTDHQSDQPSVHLPCAVQEFSSQIHTLRRALLHEDTRLPEDWRQVLNALWHSNYSAHFYGRLDRQATDGLYALVGELSDLSRSACIGFANRGNGIGAANVLAWSSGYAFGIQLLKRRAEFNGPQHSAAEILRRGECDCILLCSTMGMDDQSATLAELSDTVPVILVNDRPTGLNLTPTVQFNCAAPGKSGEGDWFRMDGVCLPVQSVIESDLPAASEILDTIVSRMA